MECVYYKIDDSDFPSDSWEGQGWFVGIAEHVGHAMTFKVLTLDTKKVIYRSNIRSAEDPNAPNLCVNFLDGETPVPFIKSRHESQETSADKSNDPNDSGNPTASSDQEHCMPTFHPSDLVGRSFLMDPREDGQCFCARIVQAIDDHATDVAENPT